jgi:hypothetical protein
MPEIGDIHDLPAWMDERLSSSSEDELAAALGIVQVLADPGHLSGVLKSLVSDEYLLAAAAKRSYTHDNGFDKIVIAASPGGWLLRLNVWWPGREPHTENIHNHRWDFASAIVAGSCRAEYFHCAEDGEEQHAYIYRRRAGSYTHEYIGTRRAEMVLSSAMAGGTHYIMTHRLMHRVSTSRGQLAATVMLHSPERSAEAMTLASTQLSAEAATAKAPMRAALLAGRLSDITFR